MARDFAHAWDAGDASKLEAWVDSSQGLWLIYNVGVAPYPFHYASLGELMAASRQGGWGMLHEAIFRCAPSSGPAPELGNCNETQPSQCNFGPAKAVLHGAFDLYLASALKPEETDKRAAVTADLQRILHVEQAELHFLTDDAQSAVFYFAKLKQQWRLVAVDTSDCSA